MKLLVLADLHLDDIIDLDLLHRLGEAIRHIGAGADALVIAGDLTEAATQRWPDAIRWLGTHFPSRRTLIVPGNHDYYYRGNLTYLDADLDRICREAGCTFAQCRRLVLENTRILMATLWTDMRLYEADGEAAVEDSLRQARRLMPDYDPGTIIIGDPERELQPEDTMAIHARQKRWLVSELARPWAGSTVVVTHHAPLGLVSGELSPLSPCFASDLEAEIELHCPDAWLFGHTHRPAELRMPGGTLLRNVSLGYEGELREVDLVERVRQGLIDLERVGDREG